eukprot:11280634-Heterocapsa_arctica.AAC.1
MIYVCWLPFILWATCWAPDPFFGFRGSTSARLLSESRMVHVCLCCRNTSSFWENGVHFLSVPPLVGCGESLAVQVAQPIQRPPWTAYEAPQSQS